MKVRDWQIKQIIHLQMVGATPEDISEKTGVNLEEVKDILKIK